MDNQAVALTNKIADMLDYFSEPDENGNDPTLDTITTMIEWYGDVRAIAASRIEREKTYTEPRGYSQ